MKYCTKCVMPDTRPGITFDENGVCAACQSYENRKNVDYKKRWQEFEELCNKYRGMNGPNGYDCMIAVSGGKDSHFQTYIMKEKMRMNPLLVSVEDNFPMTKAGVHNLKNISEAFGCDVIAMKPNLKVQKQITRYTFEKYGRPTYLTDRYIYAYPLHMAVKFNTPLLVYGENIAYEYGGANAVETYSAKDQINNGVGSGIALQELIDIGIEEKSLNFFEPPLKKDLDKLDPIYLSYFLEWNSYTNFKISEKLGFHDLTHEIYRTNHIDQFEQVDSLGFLVGVWMKYPKFGHAKATDYAAKMIRYGMLSREKAMELVLEHDYNLDPVIVRDFCKFTGYSEREFWQIVDSHYNKDIFENKNGIWYLKNQNYKN